MAMVLPVLGAQKRSATPDPAVELKAGGSATGRMEITPHPSPNFGPRRDGVLPDMVVLHYTALDSAQAALERLCSNDHEVSAHYLISEVGEVFQLVEEDQRAWHAGTGCWGEVTDVNSRSIGIELANAGLAPFPEPQMATLEALLAGIMRRWAIPPMRVIGHSDMAPGRKIDPGARFDWYRLAVAGLAVWPSNRCSPADETTLNDNLRRLGMTSDCDASAMLQAFRLRYRPWGKGPLDAVDVAIAADIAARFPVDQARLTS